MDFPRRNRIDLNTKAELAVSNAIKEVEEVGADVSLTNAVIKLMEAKTLLSNYIDLQISRSKLHIDP